MEEAPTRPSFGAITEGGEELQFLAGEGVPPLEDLLRQPNIGLEWNQKYNSELPRYVGTPHFHPL